MNSTDPHPQHVCIGGEVFTSIHPSFTLCLEHPPPPRSQQLNSRSNPADFQKALHNRTWLTPAFFIQAFITERFTGSLFERLDYSDRSLPITRTPRGWGLAFYLRSEWKHLEASLKIISLAFIRLAGSDFPDPLFWSAGPWSCGYTERVASESDARSNAIKSRDMFRALIARVLYGYLIVLEQERLSNFDWRALVIAQNKVHPAWLWELEDSLKWTLAEKGLGGVIDYNSPLRSHLPLFLRITAPIQVCWGQTYPIDVSASLKKYLPSAQEFEDIKTRPQRPRLQHQPPVNPGWDLSSQLISPPPTSSVNPGPVWPSGCSQLTGESPIEFINRMKASHSMKESKESTEDRRARLQVIEEATSDNVNNTVPNRNYQIFAWDDVDGDWTRQVVGRTERRQTWLRYTKNQRWFDSFTKQWDLTDALAPGEDVPNSEPDDDEFDGPFLIDGICIEEGDMHAISKADINIVFSRPVDLQVVFPHHNQSGKEIAVSRWGYIPNQVDTQAGGKIRWPDCLEAFGLKLSGDLDAGFLSNERLSVITLFNGIRDGVVPPGYLDFQHPLSPINSTRWPVMLHGRILPQSPEERCRYILRYPNQREAPALELIIDDPVTVLEVIRRKWGPELTDIARELALRGSSLWRAGRAY